MEEKEILGVEQKPITPHPNGKATLRWKLEPNLGKTERHTPSRFDSEWQKGKPPITTVSNSEVKMKLNRSGGRRKGGGTDDSNHRRRRCTQERRV